MFPKSLILILLLSLVVTTCSSSQPETESSPTPQATNTQPEPTPVIYLHSILSGWKIDPNPTAVQNSFSFAVNLIEVSPERTVLVTSVAPQEGFSAREAVNLLDQQGNHYQLYQVKTLAELDGLRFEALTFAPVLPSATQLTLTIKSPDNPKGSLTEIPVAEWSDNIPDFMAHHDDLGNWWDERSGPIEQSRFTVSGAGWYLHPNALVAYELPGAGHTKAQIDQASLKTAVVRASETPIPTLTPLPPIIGYPYQPHLLNFTPMPRPTSGPPNPVAAELVDGESIAMHATLEIQERQTGILHFLYVIFLRDRSVKAQIVD